MYKRQGLNHAGDDRLDDGTVGSDYQVKALQADAGGQCGDKSLFGLYLKRKVDDEHNHIIIGTNTTALNVSKNAFTAPKNISMVYPPYLSTVTFQLL